MREVVYPEFCVSRGNQIFGSDRYSECLSGLADAWAVAGGAGGLSASGSFGGNAIGERMGILWEGPIPFSFAGQFALGGE